LYEAENGKISIAVTGDAMVSRRMSRFREPDFLGLIELLRGADVTIANLEMLFHDFEGSWQWAGGGTYTRSDPRNLGELKWMGVDGVLTANNHSFDYSEDGLMTTMRHLDEVDLPHAGGGRDIDHARAPGYIDSPNGRVAFMSASSTFSDISRAGAGRPDFAGRPGINALRHVKDHYVTPDVFEALHKASRELGYEAWERARQQFGLLGLPEPEDPAKVVEFLENKFRLSDEMKLKTSVHKEDLAGISTWIRGAQSQADWLVYGIHCHESGVGGDFHGGSNTVTPDFLHEFARHAIDEGCDMVAGHGPHFLRGIEIYNGKPIFYSLGNFIFQNETISWVPPEGYRRAHLDYPSTPGESFVARAANDTRGFPADSLFWQSVIAICDYEDKKLRKIRLFPIDLGFGRPIPQRGRPLLAHGELAHQVLDYLAEASKPYGTEIQVQGDVGVINL
jgi:poly-gamma-glutamate synthesis protein (capsule biosynthesis protein)